MGQTTKRVGSQARCGANRLGFVDAPDIPIRRPDQVRVDTLPMKRRDANQPAGGPSNSVSICSSIGFMNGGSL